MPIGTKTWVVNSDNPRKSHAELDGESANIGEPFSNGMYYPGDPAGGADEVAGCTCTLDWDIPDVGGPSDEYQSFDPEDADGFGRELNNFLDPTDAEAAAVEEYKGVGFDRINEALRGDPDTLQFSSELGLINSLTNLLTKGEVSENITVWRAIGGRAARELYEGAEVGGQLYDPAFWSTSLRDDWKNLANLDNIVLEIEVPAGTPAVYLDDIRIGGAPSPEKELLLQRGTYGRITAVDTIDRQATIGGRTTGTMKHIKVHLEGVQQSAA